VRVSYNVKRLQDVARGLWLLRELRKHDSWPQEWLADYQRRHVGELIEFARRHSDFYRELYGDVKPDAELAELPVVTKEAMMANFDSFVTDRRLKLSELRGHLETLNRDEYYRGEYRVITSSGSSGLKGVFVYSRAEWSWTIAAALRGTSTMGIKPRQTSGFRSATVGGPSPLHATYRMAASLQMGIFRTLRLDATDTLEHLVSKLNAFQPEALFAYPSLASLLAIEQLEGRLSIQPRTIATAGEVPTP